MDVVEAIKTRKSVRAYKRDPVPKQVLQELMEVSLRAPSFANTQPWEFAIIGGEVMEEVRKTLYSKASSGAEPHPDLPYPTFPEAYRERIRENGRRILETLGIPREDRERRNEWNWTMNRFFDAPNGIIIYIDKELGAWSILDVGIVLQTILLAAHGHGLGCTPEAAVVTYPEELRRLLGIPESKQIICGIAVGYPEPDAPINQFRSNRDPLESFVTWHGIE